MYGRYGTEPCFDDPRYHRDVPFAHFLVLAARNYFLRALYLCAVPYVLAQHPRAAKRILFFLKGMDTGAKMV